MKALDAGDKRAALALAAYKKLYEIEAEIRDRDPDGKLVERRARSKPVWDELAAWCAVRKKHEPPASKLGVALRYFTNHEAALARFLEYGEVPIDNGLVERLHVRTALTRNYAESRIMRSGRLVVVAPGSLAEPVNDFETAHDRFTLAVPLSRSESWAD